jgi:phosphinothricin acetyltransferase
VRVVDYKIDRMSEKDWETVRSIYREGISTGRATFETDAPEWSEWNTDHLLGPRFVARTGDGVVGWAALSPVSGRCVYSGVAEVSLYVTPSAWGKGIGKALLQALVQGSEESNIWTLQAGIFPENEVSIALHESCGFRVVGRRERLGQINGVWKDVILMERRSKSCGR